MTLADVSPILKDSHFYVDALETNSHVELEVMLMPWIEALHDPPPTL